MICRRCGNRIPEYLTTREYFQCPECGRQFGNPPAERARTRYESRYDRADDGYARRASRFEPEYDDSRADDSYYDGGQGYYDDDPYYDDRPYDDDGYYDDRPYDDDGYYDDRPYDDGYYDDQPYDDDGYYDDRPYYGDSQDYSDDFSDFDEPAPRTKRPKGEKRTMKLISLVYVLIAEIVALIVVACIGAGMNSEEPVPTAATAAPVSVEATADPDATANPYPVV